MKYVKILVLLGVLGLVGAGSANLLGIYGSISGTADVQPAVNITDYKSDSNGDIYSVKFNYSSPKVIDSGRLNISSSNSTDVVSGVDLKEGTAYNATVSSGGDLEMKEVVGDSGTLKLKIDGKIVDSSDTGGGS